MKEKIVESINNLTIKINKQELLIKNADYSQLENILILEDSNKIMLAMHLYNLDKFEYEALINNRNFLIELLKNDKLTCSSLN